MFQMVFIFNFVHGCLPNSNNYTVYSSVLTSSFREHPLCPGLLCKLVKKESSPVRDLACAILQYSRDTQKATRTWAAEQRGIYYSPEPDYLGSNPGLPVKLGEVTLCFSASFSLRVKQRVVAVPQRNVHKSL